MVKINAPEEYQVMGDYIFSEEEKKDIAKTLAEKNLEIKMLENEKKETTASFAARIFAAKSLVDLNSTYLNTGKMQKRYTTHLRINKLKGIREYKDVESGAIVKTEPMRPEDYQMKFNQAEGQSLACAGTLGRELISKIRYLWRISIMSCGFAKV